MTIASTSTGRKPHDLSHLIFNAGKIGRLQTLATTPVIAGDSYEENLVGSLRLSPLRRGLAVDSVVDIFSFYVPHRHTYGEEWVEFMKDGMKSTPLTSDTSLARVMSSLGHLGFSGGREDITKFAQPTPHAVRGYEQIYNNYFKVPYLADKTFETEIPTSGVNDSGKYGYLAAHLKNLWTTPLPPMGNEFADFNATVSGSDATIDLMDMNRQYAMLHTEQERDLFMLRYRDVMKQGFGGSASVDAEERPTLLKRTTFWASGYDVNGTDQESLGQYSGRVQQSFSHRVPRKYIREHGTVWTMALVRFPVTHQGENHVLSQVPVEGKGIDPLSYEVLAGDPAITANSKPQVLNISNIFSVQGHDFEVPHSQYYRTQPDTVHGDYELVMGFPFMKDVPQSTEEAVYINPNEYSEMFQTEQLGQWQVQARRNINVIRRLPSARDAVMTNN